MKRTFFIHADISHSASDPEYWIGSRVQVYCALYEWHFSMQQDPRQISKMCQHLKKQMHHDGWCKITSNLTHWHESIKSNSTRDAYAQLAKFLIPKTELAMVHGTNTEPLFKSRGRRYRLSACIVYQRDWIESHSKEMNLFFAFLTKTAWTKKCQKSIWPDYDHA